MTTPSLLKPQEGPQTSFLQSNAEIAIYGGAAGGGKTWAELIEPLYHVHDPNFGAVIFRRSYPQIMNEGGLWDESLKIYPLLGAIPRLSDVSWHFQTGAKVSFRHLQYDMDVLNWQGAQIPLIEFDELTHFSEYQFWYMMSRNRTTCSIRPYMRATTNPDADSWVTKLISWWIDPDSGLPIPERGGVIRYFVRIQGEIEWADSAAELTEKYPGQVPKSFTFIPATVYDNPALLRTNPSYLGNLLGLPPVEQGRLLGGNWKIRPAAGKIFNRDWFEIVGPVDVPDGVVVEEVRFWDFASTAKKMAKDDPDFTASVKMRRIMDVYYIVDCIAGQWGPAQVEQMFIDVTRRDIAEAEAGNRNYAVRWEIEPGSAGFRETYRLTNLLAGVNAGGVPSEGEKYIRSRPLVMMSKPPQSNVKLLKGPWNEQWLNHMHNQPDIGHDDIHDASAGAYNELCNIFGSGIYV